MAKKFEDYLRNACVEKTPAWKIIPDNPDYSFAPYPDFDSFTNGPTSVERYCQTLAGQIGVGTAPVYNVFYRQSSTAKQAWIVAPTEAVKKYFGEENVSTAEALPPEMFEVERAIESVRASHIKPRSSNPRPH